MRPYCCQPGDPPAPAVVVWITGNGNEPHLCQRHLDMWLDNADDDPELEPHHLKWLPHA